MTGIPHEEIILRTENIKNSFSGSLQYLQDPILFVKLMLWRKIKVEDTEKAKKKLAKIQSFELGEIKVIGGKIIPLLGNIASDWIVIHITKKRRVVKRITNLGYLRVKSQFHANIIVINTVRKTIERFEPQTSKILDENSDKKYEKYLLDPSFLINHKFLIDEEILNFINKIGFSNYKYTSSTDLQTLGFQNIYDDWAFSKNYVNYKNSCAICCLFFLEKRLKYPNIPMNELLINMSQSLEEFHVYRMN